MPERNHSLAARRLATWVGIGREQAAGFISEQIAPLLRGQRDAELRERLRSDAGKNALIEAAYWLQGGDEEAAFAALDRIFEEANHA